MKEDGQIPQEEWPPRPPWLDREKGDMQTDIGPDEGIVGPYIGPERILPEGKEDYVEVGIHPIGRGAQTIQFELPLVYVSDEEDTVLGVEVSWTEDKSWLDGSDSDQHVADIISEIVREGAAWGGEDFVIDKGPVGKK